MCSALYQFVVHSSHGSSFSSRYTPKGMPFPKEGISARSAGLGSWSPELSSGPVLTGALCPSQERSQEDLDREWELYVNHLQQSSSDLHRVFNSLWALDKTKVPPGRAGACYFLRSLMASGGKGWVGQDPLAVPQGLERSFAPASSSPTGGPFALVESCPHPAELPAFSPRAGRLHPLQRPVSIWGALRLRVSSIGPC